MKMMYIVCLLAVGLVFSPALPCAQTEPGTLPQKTIGQGKPQLVPSLIVLNARGASLQGQKLTLDGVWTMAHLLCQGRLPLRIGEISYARLYFLC